MAFTTEELTQLDQLLVKRLDEKLDQKLQPIIRDIQWLKARVEKLENDAKWLKDETSYIKQYMIQEFRRVDERFEKIDRRLEQFLAMESGDILAIKHDIDNIKRNFKSLKNGLT